MDECQDHAINTCYSPIQSTTHSIPSNSLQELRFNLSFLLRKMKSNPVEFSDAKSSTQKGIFKRAVSVLDFILRLIAIASTLASAIAMGTTNETLSFFTQFIRFRAEYDDLPTLRYVLCGLWLLCRLISSDNVWTFTDYKYTI